MNPEINKLNNKLCDLENRLKLLEQSRELEKVSSGKAGIEITGALELPKINRINISASKLVEIYNDCPEVLASNAIKVSLTADSYRGKTQGQIFLERSGNGNYWVIATEDENYWLLPSVKISFNPHKLKTIELLFECQEYQSSSTNEFSLKKSAQVSLLPVIQKWKWKLEERGILDFQNLSGLSDWQSKLNKIKTENSQLQSQIEQLSQEYQQLKSQVDRVLSQLKQADREGAKKGEFTSIDTRILNRRPIDLELTPEKANAIETELAGDKASSSKQKVKSFTEPPPVSSQYRKEKIERPKIKDSSSSASFGVVSDFQTFEFEVVTVKIQRKWLGLDSEIRLNRRSSKAQYFTENLGNGVTLDMVAIPEGEFMMGAPKSEKYSCDRERPQHQVRIQPFFMGKFPVTQAQWKAVANLAQVDRDLAPYPSYFKGDNCPVEKVSWYDAVEFCKRLSRKTGKEYRLPSEAEWEYACRAGTTTPFYFGETITSKLANYNGSETYADEPKGEYRQQTTPVGKFPPNAFGLYDMHGQVWEWCADAWHENYEGATTDGNAWTKSGNEKLSPLRGGSWDNDPEDCRSAIRGADIAGLGLIYVFIGFRVVCVGGRTE
ncbi:MAG: SUMF1/EgtB/PvdO family nonheme iron enzyme [Prochloraceae cyanobacterium]|nr:SUMF1/EgtB/PvdO family nonheme iron enzyme [Prochloraceae cyanobacterium]